MTAMARLDGTDADPDVIVVGAGVSGCACAAALAEAGARVLVVSSSLDVVGLPGYGPEVAGPTTDWDRVEEVFSDLPAPLAVAWLDAALVTEGGRPFMIVDRRAVSIETKRLLESIPGLHFRQGSVVDVRTSTAEAGPVDVVGGAQVEVETAFGEVLRARAVVLAVGLGLGGVLRIGDQEMPGGRYGEIPAEGLLDSLTRAGAVLQEVELHVGPRYGSCGAEVPAAADAGQTTARTKQGTGEEAQKRTGKARLGSNSTPVEEETSDPGREHHTAGGLVGMLPLKDIVNDLRARDASGRSSADSAGADVDEERAQVRMARLLQQRSMSGDHDCAGASDLLGAWPADAPPAPHKTERFVPSVAVTGTAGDRAGAHEEPGPADGRTGTRGVEDGSDTDSARRPVLLPDGAATLEFYEIRGSLGGRGDEILPSDPVFKGSPGIGKMVRPTPRGVEDAVGLGPASRLGYIVRASILQGLAEGHVPEMGPRVWATGRVTGATDYLDCLRHGVNTARLILNQLEHHVALGDR